MALNGVHKWSMEGSRYPASLASHHSRSVHGGSSSWATREARPVDVFLALAVALVVIAVLCIAGLAIYLGAMRIDARSTDILLDGRLQVSGGAPSAPQLQLALLNSTSSAFHQAARFYTALLERVYKRSELGPALRSAAVRGFSLRSSTLVVFFRLQLDRRRTTTIEVEDVARSILVQEATALKPIAFTDMQMDVDHIVIKRHEEHQDEDEVERKNATQEVHHAGPPSPGRLPPPGSPSTATLSTVTTRPLVLSTQQRGQQGRPSRTTTSTTTTTTTTTTTSTTTQAPVAWEEATQATLTFTGTGPPVTEVVSRNRAGSPILALDATDPPTTVPSAAPEPPTPSSTSPAVPHPTGVVEPIAKEDVVVDPWNAPYGGAASRRPPVPMVPASLPDQDDDDSLSSWRPVRPTHQQTHQQNLHLAASMPAVPILLPTASDEDDISSVVGVAEVVPIPSSALEGSINVTPGGGSMPVITGPDAGLEAAPEVAVGPGAGPGVALSPLVDRLSLSPSEAFRQDLLLERDQSRPPVNTYAGDVGARNSVRSRPGDTISKISLIVSGEDGNGGDPDTSILQTGSGSIVIASTQSPATTSTTSTSTSTAPPTSTEPSTTTTIKQEVAKAEMRNSNIRMPGLFSLPDLPLLQQFPNLLSQRAQYQPQQEIKEEVKQEVKHEVKHEPQQVPQQVPHQPASPAPPPASPASPSPEESVSIVTLLPVRSNSGLRRPLRRKPVPRPQGTPTPPPPPPPPSLATSSTPTLKVPPAVTSTLPAPRLPSPSTTPSPPPSPPPTTEAASVSSTLSKQSENSVKILSSLKLVLESRQSHYTSTPSTEGAASNGSQAQTAGAHGGVPGHVDRITHFIIPPERDSATPSPAPHRVNVAHIERVTTEIPPATLSAERTRPPSTPPQQQQAQVTSRTPPSRGVQKGVPKGNRTSTQTRAQPGRPAAPKRPVQRTPRPPRPQQTSSRLKEAVVRTNVSVGQAGRKQAAVATLATTRVRVESTSSPPPTTPAPTPSQRQGRMHDVMQAAPVVRGAVPRGSLRRIDFAPPDAENELARRGWLELVANMTRYRRTSTVDEDVQSEPTQPSQPHRTTSSPGATPSRGSLPWGGAGAQAEAGGALGEARGGAQGGRPRPLGEDARDAGLASTSSTTPSSTTMTKSLTTTRTPVTAARTSSTPRTTTYPEKASTPRTTTSPARTSSTLRTSATSTRTSTTPRMSTITVTAPTTTRTHDSRPVTTPSAPSHSSTTSIPMQKTTSNSSAMFTTAATMKLDKPVWTTTSTKSTSVTSTKSAVTSPSSSSTGGSRWDSAPSEPSLPSLWPSPLDKTEAQRNRTALLVAAIRAAVGLPAKSVSSSSTKLASNKVDSALPHKVLNKAPNASTTSSPVTPAAAWPHFDTEVADDSNATECSDGLRCGDGSCVAAVSRCNQLVDCQDGADERGCSCADYLRAKFLHRKLCDGVVDCWDYSDESDCEWCEPGRYVCPSSRVCVETAKLCDGHRDCPYGDDEKRCVSVAPDARSADDFVYHSQGFVMVRRNGQWGKLCAKGLVGNETGRQAPPALPTSAPTSPPLGLAAVGAPRELGDVVCKALTFSGLEDAELTVDGSRDGSPYFETASNGTTADRSKQFMESECPEQQVLRVSCQSLVCGERPQATSHWARSLTAGDTAARRARIVGGSNSGPGAWPWQAALYKEGEFQCGATLISASWLLSAGHCFYHALDDYWVARLGALRRGTDFASPYEQLRPLAAIVLHPGYVDAGFINDISLLRMREPVSFSDYIRPICLPSANAVLKDGTMCTVVGWGQLFEVGRVFPDTLQEVQLPTISTAECRRRTLFLPLYRVTDNMFCAGFDRGGRDACLGDSGGPLMCQESDGRWTLHGVTSNGYGCARADRPGVYTKVVNYVRWVQAVTEGGVVGVPGGAAQALRDAKTACHGHRCPLGQCLPGNRVCNGFIECSDGSDEKGCW